MKKPKTKTLNRHGACVETIYLSPRGPPRKYIIINIEGEGRRIHYYNKIKGV